MTIKTIHRYPNFIKTKYTDTCKVCYKFMEAGVNAYFNSGRVWHPWCDDQIFPDFISRAIDSLPAEIKERFLPSKQVNSQVILSDAENRTNRILASVPSGKTLTTEDIEKLCKCDTSQANNVIKTLRKRGSIELVDKIINKRKVYKIK